MARFLAVLISILLFSSEAWAAQVLDQSNIASPSPETGNPTRFAIANDLFVPQLNLTVDSAGMQFVTAGMTGKLTQVDVQLWQPVTSIGPITLGSGRIVIGKDITIKPDRSLGSAIILGEIAFSASAIKVGNFTSFDTSSLNIMLKSGEQFAISVLPSQQQTTLFGWEFGGDTYQAGAAYGGSRLGKLDGEGYAWNILSSSSAQDYGFQTWMTAVPEPESWAMMIIGFGLVGAAMRRRGISPAVA